MTDINHWRKGLPVRARTPAPDFTESDFDVRSASVPPTPKRGLRPKLSSYFAQAGPPKTELALLEDGGSPLPSWDPGNTFPNPNAEALIESIMCRLMSRPYDSLDPAFNGILMQIFEAYRNAKDENSALQCKLEAERNGRYADKLQVSRLEESFDEERQEWKSEVKRLELLIAKGKRGLAEVTRARQDSVYRRRQAQMTDSSDDACSRKKETLVEFLQKTKRFEDKAWSGQRATMRVRRQHPGSPSLTMRALSKKLQQKTSMTSVHADLPFGTPPSRDLPSTTLIQVSFLDKQRAEKDAEEQKVLRSRAVSDARTSCSEGTVSTFSCAGDLLPDEVSDASAVADRTGKARAQTENNLAAARQIAKVLACRRGVSAESVMPQALQILKQQSPTSTPPFSASRGFGIQVSSPKRATTARTQPAAVTRKPSGVMARASSFLHKFRPQLNIDTTADSGRRFSFEVGDDTGAITAPQPAGALFASKERVLRKSVSVPSISQAAGREGVVAGRLSPIQSSPLTSRPSVDSRRLSKIPSPSYNIGAIARPRQDREDSQSSLLTAIHHSRDMSRSHSSMASSVYSSPSNSQRQGSLEASSMIAQQASSNSLRDHTNALRSNVAAVAAAKAFSNASVRNGHPERSLRSNSSRSASFVRLPDHSEARNENSRPRLYFENHGSDEADATA